MAGLSAGKGTNIRTADRGYSCPAYALLPGWMLTISLCTAAAPLSAGWMHQSRYCGPDLFYCSSAAVAYSIAFLREWPDVDLAGMWPRGTRERNGRGPAATTAMWPAVLTGGRPSFEAAGQLPAGSAFALCRSVSGGNTHQTKRPATGRWRTNKGSGWMRLPPQPRAAARTRPGELQRGVTGARNEPGEAVLARHLPSRDAVRPIFLLGSAGLVRRGQLMG